MIFTQEAPLTRKWFSRRSCIRSNWNLEMLIFKERGKPENPEKNLSEQSREPTNNLTHSWREPGPGGWEAVAITTTQSLLPSCIKRVHNCPKEMLVNKRNFLKHMTVKNNIANYNHRMKFIEHRSVDVFSSYGTIKKVFLYPFISLDDVMKRHFGTSLPT